MKLGKKSQALKAKYWERHISAWKLSDLTQKAYCEQAGINHGNRVVPLISGGITNPIGKNHVSQQQVLNQLLLSMCQCHEEPVNNSV